MNNNKRIKEVKELLEILVNDLQMLELDNLAYGEAFKDAMALQAYVEAISSGKAGGGKDGAPSIVVQ